VNERSRPSLPRSKAPRYDNRAQPLEKRLFAKWDNAKPRFCDFRSFGANRRPKCVCSGITGQFYALFYLQNNFEGECQDCFDQS